MIKDRKTTDQATEHTLVTSSQLEEPAAEKASEEAAQPASEPLQEEKLEAAERKANEYYEQWLRAKAEVENTRRRAQDDVAKAHKFAIETFAQHLLPVIDSLEAALSDN